MLKIAFERKFFVNYLVIFSISNNHFIHCVVDSKGVILGLLWNRALELLKQFFTDARVAVLTGKSSYFFVPRFLPFFTFFFFLLRCSRRKFLSRIHNLPVRLNYYLAIIKISSRILKKKLIGQKYHPATFFEDTFFEK